MEFRILGPLAVLEGAEPLDLGVIYHSLRAVGGRAVEEWVRSEPTGEYSRRAWFLYEALMGETFSRYRAGEPVLFYGWSPGWVVDTLRPGRDVVWLPTPFEALPPGVIAPKGALVSGVVGCAGGQDPCRMTIGAWNYQSIVNRAFLADNPAVRKLVEQFRFPLATWIAWEGTISKTKSDRYIKKAAETWIAANQTQFDGWVKDAAAAK